MATGINAGYPRRHQALARQLEEAGCLVTEFPPGTLPLRQNFPKRNRIISGLSLGCWLSRRRCREVVIWFSRSPRL